MKLNDIRIDNSRYMECVDDLATQITEMNFGADTYGESSEVGQEGVLMFTEEAQDYYNEKYDEYDSLIYEGIIKQIKSNKMKNDNKLIAEFMGAKPLVLGGSTEYEMYGVLDCIEDGENEKHYFIDDEMRFHESWDWLIPVVKKCFCTGDNTFHWDDIMDAMCTCDIEKVYQVVLEFIKNLN